MPKRKYIRKSLNNSEKALLLDNQDNKCANSPYNPSKNLGTYKCPMWILYNGNFDESHYQFDHIDELCLTSNNNIDNFQVLCTSCHIVKTRRFMTNKKKYTTTELDRGCARMEVDDCEQTKKKRK